MTRALTHTTICRFSKIWGCVFTASKKLRKNCKKVLTKRDVMRIIFTVAAALLSWPEHTVHTRGVPSSNLGAATTKSLRNGLSESKLGPLVKRLRHRPFTAVTGVRFPYGSPKQNANSREWIGVLFWCTLHFSPFSLHSSLRAHKLHIAFFSF